MDSLSEKPKLNYGTSLPTPRPHWQRIAAWLLEQVATVVWYSLVGVGVFWIIVYSPYSAPLTFVTVFVFFALMTILAKLFGRLLDRMH